MDDEVQVHPPAPTDNADSFRRARHKALLGLLTIPFFLTWIAYMVYGLDMIAAPAVLGVLVTFAGRFFAAEWRCPQRLLLPLFIDDVGSRPPLSIEQLRNSPVDGGRAQRLLDVHDALDRLNKRPSIVRPWIRSSYLSIAAGIAGLTWAAVTVGSIVNGAGVGATTLFLLLTTIFCSLAVGIHNSTSQQATSAKKLSAELQELLMEEGTTEPHSSVRPGASLEGT